MQVYINCTDEVENSQCKRKTEITSIFVIWMWGGGVYYCAKNKITESDSKTEETREAPVEGDTSLVITRPGTEPHRRPFVA